MPSKNFIVAIELGSTKITGIAGQKNHDGSFTVNAVVKEDSTACIRKGVVYNADKTVQCITNVITRLKTAMKTEIAQVYVGVGGQSIHSVRNVMVKDLADSALVTADMVNELMDNNRAMQYKDFEILDVVAQEYKVAYLNSDFKKKNGYKRSVELSEQYGMYRQYYCGCVYSKKERDMEIAARKEREKIEE